MATFRITPKTVTEDSSTSITWQISNLTYDFTPANGYFYAGVSQDQEFPNSGRSQV